MERWQPACAVDRSSGNCFSILSEGVSEAFVLGHQFLKARDDLGRGRRSQNGFDSGFGVDGFCPDEIQQEVMCRLLPGEGDGGEQDGPEPRITFFKKAFM